MPRTWLKAKYRTIKTKGRYRSSSNDSGGKTRRVVLGHYLHARPKDVPIVPEVTLVLLPSGKRRFVREYPDR
jgi:hypothetical protein